LGEASSIDAKDSAALREEMGAKRLDQRLSLLHREIYDALLRPSEFFDAEERSLDAYFWPDLKDSSIDQLLSAFLFFFAGRPASQLSVVGGLNVLRSVFFNHEASEPQHWVHTSLYRLMHTRPIVPQHAANFTAPRAARIDDMAFVVNTDPLRPPTSSGWITGRVRRGQNGLCQVRAECYLDESLADIELDSHARNALDTELRCGVFDAFGWALEAVS
jgi:hypothetical protein